jgi:hypothetical protein
MKRSVAHLWFVHLRPMMWRIIAFILRFLPISSRQGGVPKGVIWDAAEWIRITENARPWAERGSRHWQVKVRESELYIGDLPRTIEKSIHPVFYDQRFFRFPELSVTCIRRGRVATSQGIVISPEDYVFDEFTHQWGESIWKSGVFLRPGLPRMEYRDGVWATLVAPASGRNAHHWLTDGLLRLAVLEEAGLAKHTNFIIPDLQPLFLDSMEALGYGAERCAGLGSGHWEVEHLLVPSFLAPPGFMRPWGFRWLRNRLGIEGKPPGKRRFWIGRNRARGRHLLNEKELLPILKKAGFEYVELEDLSFSEQMKLFSQAGAIAAPHGAGVTDLLFAPRRIRVLELFPERYIVPVFCMLAHVLDQEYFYLIGTTTPDDISKDFNNMDNYRVAPERLIETLRMMSLLK